jgi:REP element-mobilizing transposase RayT
MIKLMTEDSSEHQRRSIRLKGYDYTLAGAYFVTLVTWQRERLFGRIVEGEMCRNELGEIVAKTWSETAIVRPNVVLEAFVVMPNHTHGIIGITDDGVGRAAPYRAQAACPYR